MTRGSFVTYNHLFKGLVCLLNTFNSVSNLTPLQLILFFQFLTLSLPLSFSNSLGVYQLLLLRMHGSAETTETLIRKLLEGGK